MMLHRRILLPAIHAVRGDWPYGKRSLLERSQWGTPDELEELQSRKLRRVMEAASGHAFYTRRWSEAGIDWRDIRGPRDLPHLPVLEKSDLAELLLGDGMARAKGFVRQTSGTSGIPIRLIVDREAAAWSHAVRLRCQGWFGIRPGDREARLWGRPLAGSRWSRLLRDGLLNRSTLSAEDVSPAVIDATLRRLLQSDAQYVYGYASLVKMLAGALAAGKDAAVAGKFKAVVCTAEESLASERRRWAELFGCPVVSEYGCSEVEIMAYECREGSSHVQAEGVVLESVPDPAFGGEPGAVVTDLNNIATPLLRYRVGDLVELSDEACACGRCLPVLARLRGRSADRFIRTGDGGLEHASTLAYAVEDAIAGGLAVSEFRVTQADAETLVFEIRTPGHVDRGALQDALIRSFRPLAARGMRFVWTYPDVIAREPGRKFAYFRPLRDDRSE